MTKEELYQQILSKKSYLCVGLDSDISKIPDSLKKEKDPVYEFNRRIIDATANYCVAYKPNIAFYEAMGAKGWESLQKTLEYIPKDIFTIADAKRGDIGNTSTLYARAFFENMSFDSVTVAPYMGADSVKPFLEFKGKWVILLALTSNPGAEDFQKLTTGGEELYKKVLRKSQEWGNEQQLMYVVGATRSELFTEVRKVAPDNFLLVPGIGAQGGDLKGVSEKGMNAQCGLLVNASRSIIYASSGQDFSKAAAVAAKELQEEMASYLDNFMSKH